MNRTSPSSPQSDNSSGIHVNGTEEDEMEFIHPPHRLGLLFHMPLNAINYLVSFYLKGLTFRTYEKPNKLHSRRRKMSKYYGVATKKLSSPLAMNLRFKICEAAF